MKEIITALNAAYKECGYVQKAGRNKEQNYKFAGESHFIEAVRPVLMSHGIVVFPSSYRLIVSENYPTKSGGRMNRIVAEYGFTFAHTSGESITVVAVGEGADAGDKASPKAATIALKYALRQALIIETGDDPDAHTPEERAPEPSAQEVARQKANAGKADKVVARGLELFGPMRTEDIAAWHMDPANTKAIDAFRWVKDNFPEKWAEIQGLGYDLFDGEAE